MAELKTLGHDTISLLHTINDDTNEHEYNIEQSYYYDDNELITSLETAISPVTIMTLNCCSLAANHDSILILIEKMARMNCYIDILCLQETWLSEHSDYKQYNIDGYDLFYQPAVCSSHTGLITYVRSTLQATPLSLRQHVTGNIIWESLILEITLNNKKKLIVGNIYRPPREDNNNLSTFIDEFADLISSINRYNYPTYLCGDYNINLIKMNERRLYEDFFEVLALHCYLPNITLPTRLSSRTLIDNIYSNSMVYNSWSGILLNNISDHQPCFTVLETLSKQYPPAHKCRSFRKKTDYNALRQSVKNYISINITDNMSGDEMYNNLVKSINDAQNEQTKDTHKFKFNKYKHKKTNWITNGLIKSIHFRDGLYKQLVLTDKNTARYNTLKINLTTYNRILNKAKRALKKQYYTDKFTECKSDIKRTWQLINEVLGNNSNKNISDHFMINNECISNPKHIANQFNNFFVSVGSNQARNITQHNDMTHNYYLRNKPRSTFTFHTVTTEEVNSIITNIPRKKSVGHDGISSELLKTLKDEILTTITTIINKCIISGIYPEKMKISRVKPLYKKGDQTLMNNYRPISLLPAISKVFEGIIFSQLYSYFSANDLFTSSQYGFRKNHSTELAAIELIDRITNLLEHKKTPFNIYIDLSKAFDTLDHRILLSKLQFYGVNNVSLILIENYLCNRKQFCEYNDVVSNILNIDTGVPQGSTLGPLFFSIYINDIVNCSTNFKFLMYADDTTLYSTIEQFDDGNNENIDSNIITEMHKITKWLDINKLSMNESKTKMMIFYLPPKKIYPPTIILNNTQIEIVENFNFLGININKSLKWKPHVDNISNKILKYTAVIKRTKAFIPYHILVTLYKSLVLPILYYGILLWGTQSERLYRLQKRIIRIITNSYFIAHSEPIYKSLNLLKLPDMYRIQLYKLYYKIKHQTVPTYFKTMLIHMHNPYNTSHCQHDSS